MNNVSRWFGALSLVGALACSESQPTTPATELSQSAIADAFTLRIEREPVVFAQLYPQPPLRAQGVASPPPYDPRYFASESTVVIHNASAVFAHLSQIQTTLTPRDGPAVRLVGFDSNCQHAFDLNPSANRQLPPGGSLRWCVPLLATPDTSLQHSVRFEVTLELGRLPAVVVTREVSVQFLMP